MIPGEDDPASSLVAEVRTGKIVPVRKGKDEREETKEREEGGRAGRGRGEEGELRRPFFF